MREIKFRAWSISEQCFVTFGIDNVPTWVHEAEVEEFTGLKDKNDEPIFEGDILKIEVEENTDFHGKWSLHQVIKANGHWATSYLKSETGEKLPKGYLRGFLLDFFDYDRKLFLWSEEYEPYTEIEVIGNSYEYSVLMY